MTQPHFIAEHAELSRIDFLLDQLARAVEMGEVPPASYDRMAPRYLARRADLVAIITGANRPAVQPQVAVAPSAEGPPAGWVSSAGVTTPVTAPVYQPAPVGRRESKPVPWTTVLTFLGAFLVVVASAIFAIAVWDIIGVAGKLGLMGFLTALFYGGGWYARRIGLAAGGTALTAVASAMLLFEGWIAIDGYNLQGPLPWAAVLLVCSAVYWYTEVRLAQKFFGVIGAAAQAGWWWLLGDGLGWAQPVRLAGLAVIALVWQLAAERGRDDRTVGSLARVLEWTAPVAGALVSAGVILDLALLRNAGTTEVVCAAVVAAASGLVFWRSRLLVPLSNRPVAALAQIPLFVTVLTAAQTSGDSWWLVGVLALMAFAYDSIAIGWAGAAFALPGLLAEVGLVLELCSILHASDAVTVLSMAALAVLWGAAARIAKRADVAEAARGAAGVAAVAEVASLGLIVIASIASIAVSDGTALTGSALAAADAYLALGVLAGWYALAAISNNGVIAFGGSVWSFYALAAVMSWALPDQRPEAYAAGLVALAGVWIVSGSPLLKRYGETWGTVTRWAGRAAVALSAFGGIALGFDLGNQGTWWPAALMALTAAVYLADALVLRNRVTAAAAAAAGVIAAAYAGGYVSDRLDAASGMAWFAVSGAAAGAVVVWTLVALRRRTRELSQPAAVAAAAVVVPLLLGASQSMGHLAAGFALLALAWAGVAVLVSPWIAGMAGLATVFSAMALLSYVEAAPWATVVVIAGLGFVLGAASFTRAGGPGGRLALAAISLALSGLTGQMLLVGLGLVGGAMVSPDVWYAIGGYGTTVALAVLGVHLIAQSSRRRIEAGQHAGGFVLVCALWNLMGALGYEWIELYTTPLALYLVAAGYLHHYLEPEREFPVATDAGAVIVGLGFPLIVALSAPAGDALGHAAWVLTLSLIALGGGIVAKSRWYFFGGVASMSAVALYRSFVALADVWWLMLGFIGVAMLVIALTWERQRMLVSETRERLRRSFEDWR